MNNIAKQYYNESKNLWGEPQEYKNIKLYPLKIKNNKYINLFYALFFISKNYIPDYFVIKMSYLKFIFFNQNPVGDIIGLKYLLIDFFKTITKSNNIEFIFDESECFFEENMNMNDQSYFSSLLKLKIKFIIDNNIFDENDFDNIREILLEQNGSYIEYIEEFHPELEEHLKFINRNSIDLNFEDQLFTYASLLKIPINQIEDITLYQLKNQFERLIMIKDYELIKPLEISGQIKSKDGSDIIKHYFSHNYRTGRYDSIKLNEDAFIRNNDGLKDKEQLSWELNNK
jgi:hypothetical protein